MSNLKMDTVDQNTVASCWTVGQGERQLKAAKECRTPRASAAAMRARLSARFWTASALCRFGITCLCILAFFPAAFAAVVNYFYDDAGRLVSANYGGNDNSVFTYDSNGNLLNEAAFASANPDLAVTQTSSADEVRSGEVLQITLQVANNSAVSAQSVTLDDVLPAHFVFQTAAPSQGDALSGGQCKLGGWNNSSVRRCNSGPELARNHHGLRN